MPIQQPLIFNGRQQKQTVLVVWKTRSHLRKVLQVLQDSQLSYLRVVETPANK